MLIQQHRHLKPLIHIKLSCKHSGSSRGSESNHVSVSQPAFLLFQMLELLPAGLLQPPTAGTQPTATAAINLNALRRKFQTIQMRGRPSLKKAARLRPGLQAWAGDGKQLDARCPWLVKTYQAHRKGKRETKSSSCQAVDISLLCTDSLVSNVGLKLQLQANFLLSWMENPRKMAASPILCSSFDSLSTTAGLKAQTAAVHCVWVSSLFSAVKFSQSCCC